MTNTAMTDSAAEHAAPRNMGRRRAVRVAAGLAAWAAAPGVRAAAAPWPAGPLRWVVPFPPGGTTDVMSRAVAEPLAQALGVPVVVDNRPGASGNIGTAAVAKSAPDGQTLLLGSVATAINASLHRKLPFDFEHDFVPVVPLYALPNVLVVRAGTPARDVKQFVAWARSRPGQLNYGSSGVGTTLHLSAALFDRAAGIETFHVPHQGGAVRELLAGRLDFLFDNLTNSLPYIQAGQLQALAVTSEKRTPQLPNVPTLAEAGYPAMQVLAWSGLFLPRGTPEAVTKELHASISGVMGRADVQDKLRQNGAWWPRQSQREFAAFVHQEVARWADAVRLSGAQAA